MSIDELDRDSMLGDEGGDVRFWHMFIDYLCKRDADINTAFNAELIKEILTRVARVTRSKSANVGPITLIEIQKAFESVVGEAPDEQAAVMLQRLPGLGRVQAEFEDRQFLDTFILDGLRALDLISLVPSGGQEVEGSPWSNPLEKLGQRIVANLVVEGDTTRTLLRMATRCATLRNRVLASDIVSSLIRTREGEYDFSGLAISEGHFADFDMVGCTPLNCRILDSLFGTLSIGRIVPEGTTIERCIAERIIGVGGAGGLPKWADVVADKYDASENIAAICRAALTPSQKILVGIIKKTFFQKGSGRKEEALLRGFGQIASSSTANRILNVLLREGVLDSLQRGRGIRLQPKSSDREADGVNNRRAECFEGRYLV